jgi:ATP-dependent Clp protease protease subunit
MADEKDNNDVQRSPFLEEKAFKSRTVLVFGTINDKLAADVSKRLIALAAESKDRLLCWFLRQAVTLNPAT